MRYIAQTTISHAPTGCMIPPGDVVDVAHLTPDEVMMLESMGVIVATADLPPEPAEAAPVEISEAFTAEPDAEAVPTAEEE